MKMKSLFAIILSILAFSLLFLASYAAQEAPKQPPPLPEPPAKVFEDGTPWRAVDQEAALAFSRHVPPLVTEVLQETREQRKARLGSNMPTLKDVKRRYLLLESPILKKEGELYGDLYGPVRFMHLKHAALVNDCFECHHKRPVSKDALETTRCSACHQQSFSEKAQGRIGLKAAYHQQCMECHKTRGKGPVGCNECHTKRVPDHRDLVKLQDKPDPITVTKECLRCHKKAGEDMLTSAHWLWRGPSPYTLGAEKRTDLGKASLTINNFCIALPSNWPRCTSCHAGYGWKDANFDFSDMTKMDCLVCHDTTGTYAKLPPGAGMPYPQLDLKAIAMRVGKPSRKTCGDCHFQGGGGDMVKHGDMNSTLYYPDRNCDVHMGGMDFQCHECHKTRNHKISGRSTSAPIAEGSRSCEVCHTTAPHKHHTGEGHEQHNILNHHLNRHTEHIACQTCHSPVYAKCKPTKLWWDWSKAGDKKRKVEMDKYGMPLYSWMKGEFLWGESVKPTYLWYDGRVKRHIIGDKIGDDKIIKLTEPVGEIGDRNAKIYPFKIMAGRQMADAENKTLIVPHLFGKGGYWDEVNWQKAFETGMKAVNLPYSGKYMWVDTVMYWGLHHETVPARNALGCAQCHESLKGEKTCDRCHRDTRHYDFKALSNRGTDFAFMKERGRDVSALMGKSDYIDFRSLGYKGDPIIYGGRFKKLPLGAGAEQN